jgi:hypothetical protein
MKKFLLFGAAVALLSGLAACTSEDEALNADEPQSIVTNGSNTYVQLSFTFPSTVSRSDYTNETESSGVYSVGNENEYKIDKVYLYFFQKQEDNTFKPVTITPAADGNDAVMYQEYSVADGNFSSTSEAYEGTSAGKAAVWTTKVHELPEAVKADKTYRVYALCNRPYTGAITCEKDLLDSKMDTKLAYDDDTQDVTANRDKSTGALTIEDAKIPMSARSFNGEVFCEITPTKANTQANPCELNYEVERSYARIAFVNSNDTFNIYESSASDAKVIGQATLMAYQIVNKNTDFYTYRHVGNVDASTFAATYDFNTLTDFGAPICFGKVTDENPYVIEPYTGLKKTSALDTHFTNRLADATSIKYDGGLLVGESGFNSLQTVDADGKAQSIEYVAENTMETEAQIKGQTTGILFAIRISTFNDAEMNSTLVTAAGEKYNYGDDVYYWDGKFYLSLKGLQTKNAKITYDNMSEYGIRYFKHGVGYYEYYIRHNDNLNNTDMGRMEFAIVRNNSYELKVGRLSMSPYSGLPGDPDEDPDPNKPSDDDKPSTTDPDESAKVYLQMEVKVRPWVVRTISMDLGH